MIRKVCEVDPMRCPRRSGAMKVIAFITEHPVVDRIIDHLKLRFAAKRPPPPQAAFQEYLLLSLAPARSQLSAPGGLAVITLNILLTTPIFQCNFKP
ncbi:MAG: hypothetical protein WCB96_03115 [Candidatus Aminicenantales bacterium]